MFNIVPLAIICKKFNDTNEYNVKSSYFVLILSDIFQNCLFFLNIVQGVHLTLSCLSRNLFKIFDQHYFWSQNFWNKNIFSPKKCLVKYWIQKNVGPKNDSSPKFCCIFWWNVFLTDIYIKSNTFQLLLNTQFILLSDLVHCGFLRSTPGWQAV